MATDSLSERLKLVRNDLDLSQHGISKAIHCNQASWQGYESGKNLPGYKILDGLSKLGVNINWLLTGEGHSQINFRKGGSGDGGGKGGVSSENHNWNAQGLNGGRVWLDISQEVTLSQFYEISKILEDDPDDGK